MSYHILHITKRCYLSVDRGFLNCKYPDNTINKIALADIRAIIVIAQGVAFSNEAIARLLSQNSVIMHCNSSFQPVGWSMPFDKVVRKKAFQNQILQDKDFNYKLWNLVVKQKAYNQAFMLDLMEMEHNLYKLIDKPLMNEANIARQFWQAYFIGLGNPMTRERRGAETFENSALNYGYAVINALLYRSVIIHGLIPNLGIHHKEKFGSTPLVYDLMEPLRGFADLIFYNFSDECSFDYDYEDFNSWIKYLSENLRICRLKYKNKSFKLMDAIDAYVNSITNCFIKLDTKDIWIPSLKESYLQEDTMSNRENEE